MVIGKLCSIIDSRYGIIEDRGMLYIIKIDKYIGDVFGCNYVEEFNQDDFSYSIKDAHVFFTTNVCYTIENFKYNSIENEIQFEINQIDLEYWDEKYNSYESILSDSEKTIVSNKVCKLKPYAVFRYTDNFPVSIEECMKNIKNVDFNTMYEIMLDNKCQNEYYLNAFKIMKIITYMSRLNSKSISTIYNFDKNGIIDQDLDNWINSNIRDNTLKNLLVQARKECFEVYCFSKKRKEDCVKEKLQDADLYIDKFYSTVNGKEFIDDMLFYFYREYGTEKIVYLYCDNMNIKKMIEDTDLIQNIYRKFYRVRFYRKKSKKNDLLCKFKDSLPIHIGIITMNIVILLMSLLNDELKENIKNVEISICTVYLFILIMIICSPVNYYERVYVDK